MAAEAEALAGLRILVCIAKADGKVTAEERDALRDAFAALTLPAGTTVDSLLAEKIDLDAQVKAIASPEARDAAYNGAYSMAWADGEASAEETALLERVRAGLGIPKERATLVGRVFSEAKDTVLPSNIKAIADPEKRAKEIREDVRKYSIFTAILGAFPIPGVAIATDLAVVGLQVKMVRDIGQYHGHKVDNRAAKSLLYGLGLGTGARIAVTNVAKLVPVFGSAFGAVASFASTWALGKVADQYFASGGKADMATLKDAFKKAEKEGKKEYDASKAAIEAKKKATAASIEALNADLKAGKISQAEYEKRVDALA
ncbi:MAG: TerB family tellurite resistance protein [Planctomycetaceae bacterium]|nr:TerB family tellurite resistance protein [Planctomycetota bacterium]NUN51820.1 TerB family tellurite resistance protein [Planctomycetaceae bacterium]